MTIITEHCYFICRHHEHGALSIYESLQITIKNCTFRNNTSDGCFTKKKYIGSSGGLSIGYNYSDTLDDYFTSGFIIYSVPSHPRPIILHINITKSRFINNSALPFDGQSSSSTEALQNNVFYGRGGALSLLISVRNSLKLVFSDNKVINNFADAFGGGMYCLIQTSSDQSYTFHNNVFMNNTGSVAGGIAFIYLYIPKQAQNPTIHTFLYNCVFYNNIARSKVAGAVAIYSVLGLSKDVCIRFKHCQFHNNKAVSYGGAVDITSYDFFDSIEAVQLVKFINWLVLL